MIIKSFFWTVECASRFQSTLSPHFLGVHFIDHLSHFETFQACFLISLLHSTSFFLSPRPQSVLEFA